MTQRSSPKALDSLLAVLKTPSLAADFSGRADLWTEIKRLAEVHRFSGLLAYSTSQWLLSSERRWRDQVLMQHHQRHQAFMRQLQTFTDSFRDAGIPCIALKGPLLAERFHNPPWLKSYHDLDFLVPRNDLPAAIPLMEASGFTLRGRLFPWTVQQRFAHDVQFSGRGAVPIVEMHYALKAGPRMIQAADFVKRATTWKSPDGTTYQTLSPVDECFYLIIHAAGHAFCRLRWLYDALAMTKTLSAAERGRVRSLAIELGQTGYFVAADMACREFFGEPLPVDVSGLPKPWLWSELQPRHVRKMADWENGARLKLALHICRMSGSPLHALRLLRGNASWKMAILMYRLRGGPTGREVLMKTLQ
jgi:hypothetical protein